MGEDENIALVNVKEANSGCGPPVSELYRQMSRQSPKVYIFLDWKLEKTFRYYLSATTHGSFTTNQSLIISGSCLAGHERKRLGAILRCLIKAFNPS